MERATGAVIEQHTRLRAEAAVLLAEGRVDEARATARTGLKSVGTANYAGRVFAEEDWFRAIIARREAREG